MSSLSSDLRLRISVVSLAAGLCAFASPPCQGATGSDSNQPVWSPPVSSAPSRTKTQSDSDEVSAYAPGSNNLALDLGQVFLMGNLSGQYSDAMGFQAHYTRGVSDMFGFDSSLGYSSHSDGQFSMMSALVGLRTNLSYYDKLIPYTIFGLGFYRPSYAYQANDGSTGTLSPLLFGLHLSIGADLTITRQVFFGAALTFHDVFSGGDESLPGGGTMSVGGTYMSFLAHAGVAF